VPLDHRPGNRRGDGLPACRRRCILLSAPPPPPPPPSSSRPTPPAGPGGRTGDATGSGLSRTTGKGWPRLQTITIAASAGCGQMATTRVAHRRWPANRNGRERFRPPLARKAQVHPRPKAEQAPPKTANPRTASVRNERTPRTMAALAAVRISGRLAGPMPARPWGGETPHLSCREAGALNNTATSTAADKSHPRCSRPVLADDPPPYRIVVSPIETAPCAPTTPSPIRRGLAGCRAGWLASSAFSAPTRYSMAPLDWKSAPSPGRG
jgi:hypothetical protein